MQPPVKIPYATLPGINSELWPIVQIELATARSTRFLNPLPALVDSGANASVLHPDVADALGFDRQQADIGEGMSAGGRYTSWTVPDLIDIKLYNYTFRRRFVVIDTPDFPWPCLLGQDSLFEVARIDFYRFRNYFELRFRSDIN